MQFVGTFKAQLILAKCKDNMIRMGVVMTHNHVSMIHKVSNHHLHYD
jgi:hypothetical protein